MHGTEGLGGVAGAFPFDSKRCPRCGETLYDDMDICYGCLYDFGRDRREELAAAGVPEEFELVEAPLDEPDAVAPRPGGPMPLVGLRTDSVDLALPLPAEGLVFGSDSSCDVVVHSAAASPRHLRLVPARDGALAFDLGAECPATCGGVPVGEGTLVAVGESVALCGSIVTIASDGEDGSAP